MDAARERQVVRAHLAWIKHNQPALYARVAAVLRAQGAQLGELGFWDSIGNVLNVVKDAAGTYLNFKASKDQQDLVRANIENLRKGQMPVQQLYSGAAAPASPSRGAWATWLPAAALATAVGIGGVLLFRRRRGRR